MLSVMLKQRRNELGISQQTVAEKLHVSRQSVSNWENGNNYPDIPTLILLSDYYEISLDQLLKGDSNYIEKLNQENEELLKNRKRNKFYYVFFAMLISHLLILLARVFFQFEWFGLTSWLVSFFGVTAVIILLIFEKRK